MEYDYIMTKIMFPLDEKKEILSGVYFDNPRNFKEVKKVAEILKKANHVYSPFPETYKQYGKEYITLEFMQEQFYDKYKKNEKIMKCKDENNYKNIYYHLAKNWIIVRYNKEIYQTDKVKLAEKTMDIEQEKVEIISHLLDNYEKVIKYINLLTFISFNYDSYLDHSFLLPDLFKYFKFGDIDHNLKDIIIDFFVMSTSRKESHPINFRYSNFNLVYKQLKKNENLIIDRLDDELLSYIADSLENYRLLKENKMKIVSLVSLIELLLAHNPDGNRYNVEDSIRKQFSSNILIILHLNNSDQNWEEKEKLLLYIYDLRSSIAHGNFDAIEKNCKKIYSWILKNEENLNKLYETFDEYSILDYVNVLLRQYFRIILRNYLSDEILFNILKK